MTSKTVLPLGLWPRFPRHLEIIFAKYTIRMSLSTKLAVLLALSVLASLWIPAASADSLDGALQCPCDCGEFLVTCDCNSATSAKSFIEGLRASGKGDAEIAEAYGARFGESYVNYVAKEGSGLSLWLLPPIGAVVGAAAIYYRLKNQEGAAGPAQAGIATCGECGAEVASDQGFCTACGTEVDVTRCGSCGSTLEGDASFCTSCGSEVGSACPSCGETAAPGSSFCSSCGEGL